MKLWAIFKTLLFIAGAYYLVKYISSAFSAKNKAPRSHPPRERGTSTTVHLKEKGKGRLPDGTEYTEYE